MSKRLVVGKEILKNSALECFTSFAEDLPLVEVDFKIHYSRLGEVIYNIETIESFAELCMRFESECFNQLGWTSCMLDEFFEEIESNLKKK